MVGMASQAWARSIVHGGGDEAGEVKMIEVTGAKIRQAFVTFKHAYNSGWREARAPFKRLVYVENFNRHQYLLSEDEAARVELMNSDHGHAYCKMLIAKETSVEEC